MSEELPRQGYQWTARGPWRRTPIVLLLLFAGLLLVGCSSSPAEPPAAQPPADAATAVSAAPTAEMMATVAPVVGPLIGIDISADTIKQLGGQTAEVARGIAGLVGTILAIYGRTRAVQPLMRREVALRL